MLLSIYERKIDVDDESGNMSPTKLRTSPRKKAWASPAKSPARTLASSLFKESDFSPLNKSWAEITEEDTSIKLEPLSQSEGRRRKHTEPKRAVTKPKFVRSLELSDSLFTTRRSERIKREESIKEEEIMEIKTSTRKRCLSNASTIPDLEEEGPSPRKRTPHKSNVDNGSGKPARKTAKGDTTPGKSPSRNRALFGAPCATSSPSTEFNPKDFWENPTLGWCTDVKTLERRTKEVDRAKEKPVYTRYLEEVPKHKRVKGIHPRTPNKLINFSRRSWDVQLRTWKRSLYQWAGEEPSESANTSFCNSDAESIDGDNQENDVDHSKPILAALKELEVPIRQETDAMASLLGRFDIDSRRGDESTLKASTNGGAKGPVDFSTLSH